MFPGPKTVTVLLDCGKCEEGECVRKESVREESVREESVKESVRECV